MTVISFPVLHAGQEAALNRLTAELRDHQDNSDDIPCTGPAREDWISDHRDRQEFAAQQCHACPALQTCTAYALEHPEPAGVWGGLTPKRRQELRRTSTSTERNAA